MSAVTLGVAFGDSNAGNLEAVPVTAFTPAVGDLLVAVVLSAGTAANGVLSSNTGVTFTRLGNAIPRMELYVANQLVPAAVSTTLTITHTGDATTGVAVCVLRVSGMTRVGAGAVRQWLNADNGASGTAPSVTLPVACLTGNSTLFFAGAATAAPAFTEPAGWTERMDSGFTTPTVTLHASSRDSGFTGTVFTAGATVAATWGALAVELDASIPPKILIHEVDMLETVYAVGAADQEVDLKAWDLATGAPVTTIDNTTSGLTLAYARLGAAPVTATGGTIVAVTTSGAHADWGIVHKSAGVYRVCMPDAAGAAPNPGRYLVTAYGVSGVAFSSAIVELTGSDPRASALTKEQIAVEALLTLAYARGHRVYESNVSGVLTPGGGYVTVTDTDGTTILSTQPMVRSAAGVLGAVNAGG